MNLISDQDRAMMDTLIQRAHDLACHLQDEAMACEDLSEKRALAADFHRVSRAFRQTLALKLRVSRETAQAQKAALADAEAQKAAQARARDDNARRRTQAHRARIENTLTRLISERHDWDECDTEEDLDRLSRILDTEELREDFDDTPPEDLLVRIARRVGIEVQIEAKEPPPFTGEER